jgi:hypothetical protein
MLSFQVYNTALSPTGLLADFTSRIHPDGGGGGLTFSTGAHGFAALEAPFIPMSLHEAFEVYAWPGTPHVSVSDGAAIVWEGRLEDISIVPGGVSLRAFGYQRALSDVLYTALLSYTGSADWRQVTADDVASRSPSLYEMDNNNRLFIAPRNGETFANTVDIGELTYALPHLGGRNISAFSAEYSITLPANWEVKVLTCDFGFTNMVTEATVTATGSNQTGSWSLGTSARQRVIISVRNNTGGNSTIAVDTGEQFVKITGIRIKTESGTVLASDIAQAMAAYVNLINPGQLDDSAARIVATTTDLENEIYQDARPADILNRLAYLHTYQWAVWEGRQLSFHPKGSAGRHYYVDVSQILELQRSLENVENSVYAIYRNDDSETLRRAAAENTESQDKLGLIRHGVVDVQTTSATEAETHRDVYLADKATAALRARVNFARIYDEVGGSYPLYTLRAGDTLTMRNLPPTLSTAVDQVRTFMVGETSYDAATGIVSISPEEPTPSLDLMIARREAGF